MLNIIEYGKDGYEFPALIVLGCFDAIHAGHRELLKKAKLQAKINGLDMGVMMFREGKSGKLVYSFEERCALLEQYNVKFVLAVDFNDDFKKVAPLDFLHEVEDKINVKAYMSGKDFRFGAQAKGKSSTLKNYAEDEENGVWYMSVKDVDLNGEKISTTLIKACLDEGNVAKANQLLGGEFSVSGEVVKGEGRGTSVVGFPTVNIVYPEWKHPVKHGVYSVKCTVGETDYQGIANFGNCPTFADERIALEVYLEGFSGDLYGQVLTIRFIDYIRDIEEFGSAEELSGQLQSDLLSVSDELAVTESEVVTEDVTESETVAVTETVPETETLNETVPEVEAVAYEEVAEVAEETVVEGISEEAVTEEIEEPIEELAQPTEEEPAVEEVYEDFSDDGLDEIIETAGEETIAEEQVEEEEQPVVEVAEEEQPEEVEQSVEEVLEEEQVELTEQLEQPADETIEEIPADEIVAEEMQYADGEATAETEEIIETEEITEPAETVELTETETAETIEEIESIETDGEDKIDGEEN